MRYSSIYLEKNVWETMTGMFNRNLICSLMFNLQNGYICSILYGLKNDRKWKQAAKHVVCASRFAGRISPHLKPAAAKTDLCKDFLTWHMYSNLKNR